MITPTQLDKRNNLGYTQRMENSQPQPDLADEIAQLLRAGCEIRFTPRPSAYGIVTTLASVQLPILPRTTKDEIAQVTTGGLPSAPLLRHFNLAYEKGAIAAWLQEIRTSFIRH